MRLPRQFSLRSLLLLILTGASAVSVTLKWEAWQPTLILKPTGGRIRQAAFSPDGSRILTHASPAQEFSDQKVTTVWSRSGTRLYETDWCYDMGASGYDGAEFKYGSRWLFLQYMHHTSNAQLVDLRSQKMLFPEKSDASCVAFSKGESRCAVTLRDKSDRFSFSVYDLETGKLVREERQYFTGPVQRECREVRISADGRRVIAIMEEVTADKTCHPYLLYFDVETGVIRRSAHTNGEFYFDNLAFSSDGTRALICDGSELRILDYATDSLVFQKREIDRFNLNFRTTPSTLNYFLYESGSNSYWLDLNAKELHPTRLNEVSLKDAQVADEWVAWNNGVNIRLTNILTGATLESLAGHGEMSAGSWRLQAFTHGWLVNGWQNDESHYTSRIDGIAFMSVKPLNLSPDGRAALCGSMPFAVFALKGSGSPRGMITGRSDERAWAQWSPDSNAIITFANGPDAYVWSRVRDDSPGALLWQPETIVTALFALALIHSIFTAGRNKREAVVQTEKP